VEWYGTRPWADLLGCRVFHRIHLCQVVGGDAGRASRREVVIAGGARTHSAGRAPALPGLQKDVARGLRLRCDGGPQYIVDSWINTVRFGLEPRRIGTPPLVGPRGDDRPGGRGIAVRGAQPARREELMLAHQRRTRFRGRPRHGGLAAPAPCGSLRRRTASRSGHGGSQRPGRGR